MVSVACVRGHAYLSHLGGNEIVQSQLTIDFFSSDVDSIILELGNTTCGDRDGNGDICFHFSLFTSLEKYTKRV